MFRQSQHKALESCSAICGERFELVRIEPYGAGLDRLVARWQDATQMTDSNERATGPESATWALIVGEWPSRKRTDTARTKPESDGWFTD